MSSLQFSSSLLHYPLQSPFTSHTESDEEDYDNDFLDKNPSNSHSDAVIRPSYSPSSDAPFPSTPSHPSPSYQGEEKENDNKDNNNKVIVSSSSSLSSVVITNDPIECASSHNAHDVKDGEPKHHNEDNKKKNEIKSVNSATNDIEMIDSSKVKSDEYHENSDNDNDSDTPTSSFSLFFSLSLPHRILLLLLCLSGFCQNFRPSDPYLTPFLVEIKGFTLEEINENIYPLWTYCYVSIFPIMIGLSQWEILSYNGVIKIGLIGQLVTQLLLLYGESLFSIQLTQFTFSIATAGEIFFYSYVYTLFPLEIFIFITSAIRSSTLIGYMASGYISQLMVSEWNVSLVTLVKISVGMVVSGNGVFWIAAEYGRRWKTKGELEGRKRRGTQKRRRRMVRAKTTEKDTETVNEMALSAHGNPLDVKKDGIPCQVELEVKESPIPAVDSSSPPSLSPSSIISAAFPSSSPSFFNIAISSPSPSSSPSVVDGNDIIPLSSTLLYRLFHSAFFRPVLPLLRPLLLLPSLYSTPPLLFHSVIFLLCSSSLEMVLNYDTSLFYDIVAGEEWNGIVLATGRGMAAIGAWMPMVIWGRGKEKGKGKGKRKSETGNSDTIPSPSPSLSMETNFPLHTTIFFFCSLLSSLCLFLSSFTSSLYLSYVYFVIFYSILSFILSFYSTVVAYHLSSFIIEEKKYAMYKYLPPVGKAASPSNSTLSDSPATSSPSHPSSSSSFLYSLFFSTNTFLSLCLQTSVQLMIGKEGFRWDIRGKYLEFASQLGAVTVICVLAGIGMKLRGRAMGMGMGTAK